MTNLYAYFGSFGTDFTLDVPGHTFYQIGLLDSIRKTYGDHKKFSVYSYISEKEPLTCSFPNDLHGNLMRDFSHENIEYLVQNIDDVIDDIKNRKFNKIFLKARFRNLSSLSKKLKDTSNFERILETIISSGFPTDHVYIIDTDLSLPQSFIDFSKKHGIHIVIPSIDFPGISIEMAAHFIDLNFKEKFKEGANASSNVMFYGNIDSGNYKKGHEKSKILQDVLDSTGSIKTLTGNSASLSIVAKITPEIQSKFTGNTLIKRNERLLAWNEFISSNICLNVTKDKYNEIGFIPARLYEAIIFGAIPVSYKFDWIEPGLSFENVHEYSEILKFLMDLSPEDLGQLYRKVALKIAMTGNK